MTKRPLKETKKCEFLSDFQLYLFNEGNNFQSYKMLGAHPYTLNGVSGNYFDVWAPNAKAVSVVGDFNSWDIN